MTNYEDDEYAMLDKLEAQAEEVNKLYGENASSEDEDEDGDGADFTEKNGDVASDEAEDESSENDSQLAKAAGFGPSKKRPRKREPDPANDEEDDTVLRTASWRDMEDARKFLTIEHRERLSGLINRWEHENLEEGDDVDLNTGLIVRSTGHLQALVPQQDLALFGESEDEDENEFEEEDDDDDNQVDGVTVDPLFTACQKPALVLNGIIEFERQRWIL